MEWYRDLKSATSFAGRPIEYNPNTEQEMRQAGFVDVEHFVYRLPFDCFKEREKLHAKYWKLAQYYNESLRNALDALSVAPLTRVYPQKYPVDEWRRRLEVILQALRSDQLYGYNRL